MSAKTLVIKKLVILAQALMLFPTGADTTSPHLGRYSLCHSSSPSMNVHSLSGMRFTCFHRALLGGVDPSAMPTLISGTS